MPRPATRPHVLILGETLSVHVALITRFADHPLRLSLAGYSAHELFAALPLELDLIVLIYPWTRLSHSGKILGLLRMDGPRTTIPVLISTGEVIGPRETRGALASVGIQFAYNDWSPVQVLELALRMLGRAVRRDGPTMPRPPVRG